MRPAGPRGTVVFSAFDATGLTSIMETSDGCCRPTGALRGTDSDSSSQYKAFHEDPALAGLLGLANVGYSEMFHLLRRDSPTVPAVADGVKQVDAGALNGGRRGQDFINVGPGE